MRIWSLHHKYLDAKGLVALWRETLLAQHVLEGKTKGYKNHPQLNRFKNLNNPVDAINQYLSNIYNEAAFRGYNFNKEKINWDYSSQQINVTNGQLHYEFKHLLQKLKHRNVTLFEKIKNEEIIELHPIFNLVEGDIETWEII